MRLKPLALRAQASSPGRIGTAGQAINSRLCLPVAVGPLSSVCHDYGRLTPV